MSTTTYSFPRNAPAKRIGLAKLQKEIAEHNAKMTHHLDELKDLGAGCFALLKQELGFMEMLHHVAVYETKPGILQKDRLELVISKEFDSAEEAEYAFKSLS